MANPNKNIGSHNVSYVVAPANNSFDNNDMIEIAAIASIITRQFLNDIDLRFQIGMLDRNYMIAEIAANFFNMYRHVTDWEDFFFSKRNVDYGASDWEDLVIKFAADELTTREEQISDQNNALFKARSRQK